MPSSMRQRKTVALALLLPFAVHRASADQNPRDDFCRRYGHQTTVIDDKLYIDGGFVNFNSFRQDHKSYPNTWLGFHDLKNLTLRNNELWPNLNISLTKDPDHIPTLHGGVLWGDSVNKRFFVFGGEDTGGFASADFHLHSYDILNDKWDDFGIPAQQPNVAGYGAGVGVSETGQGYYYGGWISNASMRGWTQPRTMSSSFYKYEYDSNTTSEVNSPDNYPRAEGAMVWIPAGDTGMLVYFGGLVSPDNGTATPRAQPLDEIFLYDPSSNAWETQKATGEIPVDRRQFCAGAAWAPDRSSYNIYIWGGLNAAQPGGNLSARNDLYILTLPSFIWLKVFPDHQGNATYDFGHYAASCNMVFGNSQMFVIGGTYPNRGDEDRCDLAQHAWAQHNLFTGTKGNVGDNPNGTYWALPDPSITSNVVPSDVYKVVGGDKNGGATLLAPKSGYDTPNGGLQTLLVRKPTFAARSPTRPITTSTAPPSSESTGGSSSLSTGAIVGIVIGSLAGLLALIILACWLIGRRRIQRRDEQQQLQQSPAMSEPYYYAPPSMVSPPSMQDPFAPPAASPPVQLDDTSIAVAPAEIDDVVGPRGPPVEIDDDVGLGRLPAEIDDVRGPTAPLAEGHDISPIVSHSAEL